MRHPVTVDFETFAIEQRPKYPPEPVSVSIKYPGKRAKFYAWGHPDGNNTTKSKVKKILKDLWKDTSKSLLFHNAKFDLDVGFVHLGLPMPHWSRIHDTLFLAFLNHPHNDKLSLKPLAEQFLHEPPEEQDAVHAWIKAHIRTSEKSGQGTVYIKPENAKGLFKVPPTKAGAFIAYAPGKLVEAYANGDVDRTYDLYKLWVKDTPVEPYERERKLLEPLLETERGGVKVAHTRLAQTVEHSEASLVATDNWLRKKLKSPDLELTKSEQVANALEKCGFITEWEYTENGNRSTSKENIEKHINNKMISNVFAYRAKLNNSLQTFMRPWLRQANATGGFIHTNWNQVRQANERKKGTKGARTGRLSSNPNFQNLTNNAVEIVGGARYKSLENGLMLPNTLYKEVCQLPSLRSFIIPDDKDSVLLGRDYSQQELRVLGHYEDGALCEAYNKNPNLDVHTFAQGLVNELLHANIPRKPIKNLGFGLIYGMGLALLADSMGVDQPLAKEIKRAYLEILPGLKSLDKELKMIGRSGEMITTWGGRKYPVEPPKMVKGSLRTFEYKLLNLLIQGSSADITKQAIINHHEAKKDSRLLLTVHDEVLISAPKKSAKREMETLRDAMESVPLDVKLLSDGESGMNWATMEEWG